MSKFTPNSLKRPRVPRKLKTSGIALPVEIPGYDNHQLFRITDDSMAPGCEKGDILRCSRAKGIKDHKSGSLVIVSLGGQNFMKRLVKADGHLLLVCDNTSYNLLKVEEHNIYKTWSINGKLRLSDLQNNAIYHDSTNYLAQDLDRVQTQVEHLKKLLLDYNSGV